jgi:hypothetical protein
MDEEDKRIASFKQMADKVAAHEYWTQGLDIAVENQPLVHRDLKGKLNIKVSGFPSNEGNELICWVEIITGDLFEGIGKLIVNYEIEDLLDESMVEGDDQIHYKNGSQEVMPKYFGIYQKALDW